MAGKAVAKGKGRGLGGRVPETHKQRFIDLIAAGGRIHQSAFAAGHDPRTFWRIMAADPAFKAEFEIAKETGAYVLVDEAERRGAEGWLEPVYGKGPDGWVEQVGEVRKYDSNLLMFTVKGRLPQYKDNPKIDLSQTHVSVSFDDRSAKVDEMWRVLADAGVDAQQIAHGRGTTRELLPAVEGVLAEPSDV